MTPVNAFGGGVKAEIYPSEQELEEGDVVAFPRGNDGLHQVSNRTDTPIREIPQSISVVPRAVLDDTAAVRVDAALDFPLFFVLPEPAAGERGLPPPAPEPGQSARAARPRARTMYVLATPVPGRATSATRRTSSGATP